VSGYFTVIVIAETKVIFIGVNNERTSPEFGDLYTGQKITISNFRSCKFYIAKISSVTGYRIRAVITMGSTMPMATGTGASFASKITGIMNMESVFAWWKLRKGRDNFYSSS